MPRTKRDVDRGLKKKGFDSSERDHTYYTFHTVNGVKTSVYTKISHGEREISDNLLAKMSRQIDLPRRDFDRLIDCAISHVEYEQMLIVSGRLQLGDE